MEIILTKKDNVIEVKTPYSTDFIADLKSSIPNDGRKWVAPIWEVSTEYEDILLDILNMNFNWSPTNVEQSIFTVQATDDLYGYGKPLVCGVISLARAFGRDTGAKLCDGVAKLEGVIGSSGSVKNWKTHCTKGTTFRFTAPSGILEKIDTDCWNVLKVESSELRIDTLLKEKEALLRRLSELEIEIEVELNK